MHFVVNWVMPALVGVTCLSAAFCLGVAVGRAMD